MSCRVREVYSVDRSSLRLSLSLSTSVNLQCSNMCLTVSSSHCSLGFICFQVIQYSCPDLSTCSVATCVLPSVVPIVVLVSFVFKLFSIAALICQRHLSGLHPICVPA